MTYDDRAEHLANLIEERLGIRGSGLEAKLRRAGRLLPRRVQRDAARLLEAQRLQAHPKLARQVNDGAIQAACRNVEAYLATVDPKSRRMDGIVSLLSSNAINLLATASIVIGLMLWRGYL